MYPRGENKKKEESEMGFLSSLKKIKHRVIDFMFELIHVADVKGKEIFSEKLAPWALASDIGRFIKEINSLNRVFVQQDRFFKDPIILLVISKDIDVDSFYRSLRNEFDRNGWGIDSSYRNGVSFSVSNENRKYNILISSTEDIAVKKKRLGEPSQVMEIF